MNIAVARSGWVTPVAVLYLIAGVFNLLVGLVALGVTISGSATVETVYVGDWPTNNLEGAAWQATTARRAYTQRPRPPLKPKLIQPTWNRRRMRSSLSMVW